MLIDLFNQYFSTDFVAGPARVQTPLNAEDSETLAGPATESGRESQLTTKSVPAPATRRITL